MYKVGDRFIIEIEEVFTGKATGFPQYRIKGFDKLVMDDRGLMRLSKLFDERSIYDKGYKGGLNDAWEVARKIIMPKSDCGYSFATLLKVFDELTIQDIFRHNTAAEAIAKIKAYEDKQDAEIKVGDEIVYSDGIKGIVVGISDTVGQISVLNNKYDVPQILVKNRAKKTGRTFPQIAEVLAELRGAENDK